MTDFFITALLWIALVLFLGYLLLFTLYTGSALFTWPPSIPTDRKTRKAMAGLVASTLKEHTSPSPLVLDLGSGFGHLAEQCAICLPHARIQGYEKFIVPYIGARIRLGLKRIVMRGRNIQYHHDDFFKHAPVEQADAIICFLLDGPLMQRTLSEIYPRMRPGVWLICNGAKLPGITPDETIRINYLIGSRLIYGYKKQ